jgi:hypothetical protein
MSQAIGERSRQALADLADALLVRQAAVTRDTRERLHRVLMTAPPQSAQPHLDQLAEHKWHARRGDLQIALETTARGSD